MGVLSAHAQDASPDRCVEPAAQYHGVNPQILRAILMVESRLNPGVVSRNSNGSIDVGIAGINSIHFKELAKHGIGHNQLLDACVSTYVAAWKVRKKTERWGNTWYGVAAYHSETPYFNQRYQVLLHNQLVKSGTILGRTMPVPPLKRPASAASASNPTTAVSARPAAIANQPGVTRVTATRNSNPS